MGSGFIQMKRTDETKELMKDKNAFTLLAQIAYRAKRTINFSVYNLEIGEALVGDHEEIGLTRNEYRAALKRLKSYQLITTKTTNKGTIVKLINSDIFDINEEKEDHQKVHRSARNKPSKHHRTTTNNNENNFNNDNNKIDKLTNSQGGQHGKRSSTNSKKILRNRAERKTKDSKYDFLSKELYTKA